METPTSKLKVGCCSPSDESSPTQFKDKPKQQMSASLRERLKRSRRSFTSPAMVSVAKRLCVDDEEEENRRRVPTQTKEATMLRRNSPRRDRQDVDLNRNDVGVRSTAAVRVPAAAAAAALIVPATTTQPCPPPPSADMLICPPPPPSADMLLRLRDQLKLDIKDKTETLRRLKMVQMYRGKNDLTQLQKLIDKWRACAQAALYELQASLPVDGRKASLSQLIDMFGLEDAMLHFDRTEEDFTT